MDHLHRYAGVNEPIEVCVVGSGGFGRSFLAQASRVRTISARVAVDREPEIAAEGWHSIGVDADRVALCRTPQEAADAWARGLNIAAGDVQVVLGLPLQVMVEATGHPEAGARHARLAIEAGLHVALASKEVDSVVGPELSRLARARGRVVTPVDGDQPSLLIGLVTWAQTLGFEVLSAGKSSEYDFVFDASSERMHSNGVDIDVAGFGAHWALGTQAVAPLVQARAALCHALPQRAVPDLCELQVVANSTGLMPDAPALHAPIARASEVPDLFGTLDEGGLFRQTGAIDVFNCLRAPDELSFAGGVFVVVRCDDAPTWELLLGKGHVLSRDRSRAMVYIPRHLLGLEAMTSVLDAAVHGVSSGAQAPQPRLDLVARTTRALAAGTVLTMGGHHHTIDGTAAELVPAGPLAAGTPAPFYLVGNRRLVRDVDAGALIHYDDVEIDPASELLKLRLQQDAAFFAGSRAAA
jgi:predicted homoserine dehydrogenase-like protein